MRCFVFPVFLLMIMIVPVAVLFVGDIHEFLPRPLFTGAALATVFVGIIIAGAIMDIRHEDKL